MQYVVRRPNDKEQLIQAFGDWLRRYDWKWFATFTYPPFYNSFCGEKVKMNFNKARSWFDTFINCHGKDIIYFAVMECDIRFRDGFHVHILVGGVNELLNWIYGISKVELYDRSKGAAYYVAKSIPERDFYWDFKLD